MVEVSRDGRRIYFTNSLYSAVDDQFYPDGIKGWMVKVNAKPEGGIEFDEDFLLVMARWLPPASSAPTRRRRVLGFLLLSMTSETAQPANSASSFQHALTTGRDPLHRSAAVIAHSDSSQSSNPHRHPGFQA